MNELRMIRALLDEAPPSAEVIAEGRSRIAAGTIRPRRRRARWGLTGAGLTAAALAAAVTVAVNGGAPGTRPAGPTARPAGPTARGASFGPATTVSGVLRNAALAALQLPGGAPLPDQFVYTKLFVSQTPNGSGAGVQQTWASADGTRLGLQDDGGPHDSGALPACRDGFWVIKPVGQPAEQTKLRCTAAENAAYQPAMPTSVGALRGHLHKLFGLWPGDSGGLLTNIETMMTTSYLTPAQRAALYRLLAQTPGLTVVPHVTNVRGQAGVGIRSGVYKGSIYTIIFSRATYAPLGMNWTGVAGPMKGTRNGEVLLKVAIVSNTPPLP
jgi:hypothetical protein